LRTIILALVIAALLAGCGGSSRTLGDGQWYGKLTSVDVSQRRLAFAPACFSTRRRWVARRGEGRFTIGLAEHPSLAIYYRPNGEASAGHGQGADLGQLARIAAGGRLPDFPPRLVRHRSRPRSRFRGRGLGPQIRRPGRQTHQRLHLEPADAGVRQVTLQSRK
jgi:hypothetical protein